MKTLSRIFLLWVAATLDLMAQSPESLRAERDKLSERGLWRDAVNFYEEKLCPISDKNSGNDLGKAVEALGNLNAWKEFDTLVERTVAAHPANTAILTSAAGAYLGAPHSGSIIAGEFERGPGGYRNSRGRPSPGAEPEPAVGQSVTTAYRDRVRALQLVSQATGKAEADGEKIRVWLTMSAMLRQSEAWKLQTLTPLDTLPGWGEPGPSGGTEGAPWQGDGPVLYQVPASWEAAVNDGGRWRFALAEQVRLAKLIEDPHTEPATIRDRAVLSQSQFGTETLSSYGWRQRQDPDSAKGILEMDTLAEDECLAKTSDGVRRFKLPADQHFIALYRSILEDKTQGGNAGDALVQIFLNRHQRDKAREVLERTISLHGAGNNGHRKAQLQQIVGEWGRFDTAETVPAGVRPRVPLVFRNATAVRLTASPVDVEALLRDSISYLKGNPRELDWERVHLESVSHRLLDKGGTKYIGRPAAEWELKLTPAEKHRDTRTEVEVPLDRAGAWWITGRMGKSEFHTLVWSIDSVLVENDVGGKKQWWVADAASGAPVAGTDVEFFGYQTVYQERGNPEDRRLEIRTKVFNQTTDDDGKTIPAPGAWDGDYQWLAIARKESRATAFYGFHPYHVETPQLENGNRDLSYGISDRPLYKPGDTAHLKFYLRNVGYAQPDESRWADQTGTLVITNGRGEEAMKLENLRTDSLGSVESSVVIPKDAVLGTWSATFSIGTKISASVTLGVEEYRKPEYEVKVEAPDAPVKLGAKFTATARANYFHGAPVRNAEVEIIVKRSSISERWFPVGRWDWLYGPGAWWNCGDASWHPTWDRWGCFPPNPPWWQGDRWTPDELVMKRRLDIGPDGTAKVEVDTAPAREIHGDLDARYSIEARVVDASRREERGTGSVIAARKPFEVVVWTDRGFTRAGEAVEASVSSATLAGKPVVGAKGRLTLYSLASVDDGRIVEKEIQFFEITTDARGEVKQKFAAPATGQYRVAASLSFEGGEASEGATILNVHAPGRAEPKDWHFGPLELIADKPAHAPGETLRLRVNSDKADAHVWLFLHIAGSSGREARRIQLDGKSLEVEVPLDLRDMPNMFVEGITVHGARIHTAVRQILLPPVSKLVEVTLAPAKDRVKPRETSALQVTLRDAEGRPVTGTAVLTVYDKSLEAITGGSNVAPIHETFWNWKNQYYPAVLGSSLPFSLGNLVKPGKDKMLPLGRFADQGMVLGRGMGGGARSRNMRLEEAPADAFADAVPMAMAMAAKSAAPAESESAGGGPAATPITVRKDFADLLKWSGAIQTDAQGRAEIPLEFPDNLTTWKARVWVLGKGTQVGEGSAEIITSKELMVRLQAPRFLVERDEAVFSAVVQNDHDSAKTVKVSLELDGGTLGAVDGAPRTVEIAAKSEARVDWRVRALKEGEAKFRMRADAGDDGDAVERTLPVLVHGMLRQDAWSRSVEPGADSAEISVVVPEQRRPDQSKLTVRFSPTIAGAVVDAIPYLADYPHGCTEQTLNRFVPAVIARKMLKNLNIDLAEVKAKRNNLNPQELGNAADRAAQWKQWRNNPVFDEAELEKMVAKGVENLMSMQNSDGGWGWFSGYGEVSYPHTTAVVVHGLTVAKVNGAEVPEKMLSSGIGWLMAHERKEAAALQLYVERQALREEGKKVPDDRKREKSKADALDAFVRLVLGEARRDSEPMLAFLHRDRVSLPVYAQCLLGLEHHRRGDEARRDEVMKMISQFLKRDPENQTTYLELGNNSYWWNWYGSGIEAHAWYLKLLAAVKPQDADTRGLVKYLVNNRKHATYWESTRDTAYAIEAIADYFKASGEDAPEMEVDVLMDGKSLRKVSISRENLFTFDGSIVLTGDAVTTGKHGIELRRTGRGTLYANAYLEVFTLEDKLRAAGLEVKVTRNVSKLIALEKESEVPDATGLVVKQKEERFRREPLKDGDKLASGDRIEVELVLESKNDYEYLLFSDAKAAGFESLDALSGYVGGQGGGFSAYMEPRDRTVDFFIRALPRGTNTVRYQLRAEAPGLYKALPATAEAMYAPELRANSEDLRLEITE
ncbi:MAG: MG2 domain-containing protein [Verrucomicrobiota bacterium]